MMSSSVAAPDPVRPSGDFAPGSQRWLPGVFHFPETSPAGFAREWQRATGVKGQLVPAAVRTRDRNLREGLNLVPEARHGTETFRGWLENSADSL
jgi:hypothetical protein